MTTATNHFPSVETNAFIAATIARMSGLGHTTNVAIDGRELRITCGSCGFCVEVYHDTTGRDTANWPAMFHGGKCDCE